MSTKNARILGIRLDAKDAAELEQFEQATHIEGVSLARASLKAALASYKRHGSLTLPLFIVDSSTEHSPITKPNQPTPANIVRLPPPPVVATLLHDTAAETPTAPPVTESRQEVTYQKKSRKKS